MSTFANFWHNYLMPACLAYLAVCWARRQWQRLQAWRERQTICRAQDAVNALVPYYIPADPNAIAQAFLLASGEWSAEDRDRVRELVAAMPIPATPRDPRFTR